MDNETLEILVHEHLSDLKGERGRWIGEYKGVPLLVLTDSAHDRLRIMAPIAPLDEDLGPEILRRSLEANFASALDGRYALFSNTLWAVFLHPLSEFRGGRLDDVLNQVANLAVSHGTTYSSGALEFVLPPGEEQDEPER